MYQYITPFTLAVDFISADVLVGSFTTREVMSPDPSWGSDVTLNFLTGIELKAWASVPDMVKLSCCFPELTIVSNSLETLTVNRFIVSSGLKVRVLGDIVI